MLHGEYVHRMQAWKELQYVKGLERITVCERLGKNYSM